MNTNTTPPQPITTAQPITSLMSKSLKRKHGLAIYRMLNR